MSEVAIDRHLFGLPGIAFGGYVAGIVAAGVGPSAKVSFRARTPLGISLRLEHLSDGSANLYHGETLVAQAHPAVFESTLPALPTPQEAEIGRSQHLRRENAHPMCFGCGPSRAAGEGLRIFAGPLDGRDVVAAPWRPHHAFGNAGFLRAEYSWAALDCPGGLARAALDPKRSPAVTAYLSARFDRPIPIEEPSIVLGWPIRSEGRKVWVGSAVIDLAGRPYAVAEALWVDTQ